ncbi:Dabb family protein [Sphingomonas sp. T9W2]|uniref:Dabb family protein n=1 Tax=Sphingomonas sp. T9W2 TaxID=3143183 RepID=UPI0031F4D4FD
MDRRDVLTGIGLAAATVAGAEPAKAEPAGRIRHQVFFWLKRAGNAEDRAKLVSGLKALAAISQIRELHVGVPAGTEQRDVVDASFDVSELMLFDTVADQKAYQDHPTHQAFVAACAPLWRKVVVYDSVPA